METTHGSVSLGQIVEHLGHVELTPYPQGLGEKRDAAQDRHLPGPGREIGVGSPGPFEVEQDQAMNCDNEYCQYHDSK